MANIYKPMVITCRLQIDKFVQVEINVHACMVEECTYRMFECV